MNKTAIHAAGGSRSTARQAQAIGEILAGTWPCYVLSGYAGTGKTHAIGRLVRKLQALGRPSILMAPTGRAAKVLSSRTGFPAQTIHKTIYAMDEVTEHSRHDLDGSATFTFSYGLRNNSDDVRTVYIVDEASMLSDRYSEGEFLRFGSGRLLADLIQYINFDNNAHAKQLILAGDPAQLPPVGSDSSPALDPSYVQRTFGLRVGGCELTEVVRHRSDSGILDNATSIREAIKTSRFSALDIRADKPDVRPVGPEDLLEQYVGMGEAHPTDRAIIVAMSNQQVRDYNRMVRSHYFPGASGIQSGDRLLVTANSYQSGIALMNGELLRVEMVAQRGVVRGVTLQRAGGSGTIERTVTLRFRDIVAVADSASGEPTPLRLTVIENVLDSRDPDISSDEQKALYVDFKIRHPGLKPGSAEFKQALRSDALFNAVRVKYGYAVTCHKAQGGEWPAVFVDFSTGCGIFNSGYFRWAYTAMTRARDVLYTINAPHLDALTVEAPLSPDEAREAVRTDVLVLTAGPSAAAWDSQQLADRDPFLQAIASAVGDLLGREGIAVEGVESRPYCEHYRCARGAERGACLVYFNARHAITRVLPGHSGASGLEAELIRLLAPLGGRPVVVVGTPDGADPDGCAARGLETEAAHIREAYDMLVAQTAPEGVRIVGAKAPSRYHLRCEFGRGGHRAAVDYHFNSRGRLTSVRAAPGTATSAELLNDVLALSNPGGRP